MPNLPSVASLRSASAPGRDNTPIRYVCRIASNTLLCYGPLAHALTGKESIEIDGVKAVKPYLAARLTQSEPPMTAMLLRVEEGYLIDSLSEVAFSHADGVHYWYNEGSIDETGAGIAEATEALHPTDLSKLYYLLLKFAGLQPSVTTEEDFLRICRACQKGMEATATSYAQAYWLMPGLLYLEAPLPPPQGEPLRAMHVGPGGLFAAQADICPLILPNDGAGVPSRAALLHFSQPQGQGVGEGLLSLLLKDRLITLSPLLPYTEPAIAGFISRLRALPENTRLSVRDFVTRHLIAHNQGTAQDVAAGLVRNLQCYLPPSHSTVCNSAQPFGLNVEAAYSIGRDGVFLCGWMHDPLAMREELLLYSDLGHAIAIDAALCHFPRPDVAELYREGSFPTQGAPQGFIAYLEFSAEHRRRHLAWPEGFAYRLSAQLHGGLSYTVAPHPVLADPFTLRTQLLGENMRQWLGSSTEALDVLGRAARALQEACAAQAEIRRTYQFGQAVVKPRISVVIPLYKTLDYVAGQVAHFAGDPFMKGVEIIYVLDNPPQEERVSELLRELSLLYRVPLKLIVMEQNCGFAIASNHGAQQARGDYLLLMNSDVLPKENGWLETLFDYYDRLEKPGVVAPKLLYEDGGIQHAGMYFSMNERGGHYENLHYYKGYPASHAAASLSRAVPAVSAACALISRKAFEKAGRFTTDYVLGDFEDSDLCLKLSNLGYKHYYCAEAALYHFERQSFGAAAVAESLRYRLNAREHHRRWHTRMEEMMEAYHGR